MPFQIRDGRGIVHNTVEHPAALFDKNTGTLHKIGERDTVKHYFEEIIDKTEINNVLSTDLTIMDLPEDQEEIDKVFMITGYIKELYEKSIASENGASLWKINH